MPSQHPIPALSPPKCSWWEGEGELVKEEEGKDVLEKDVLMMEMEERKWMRKTCVEEGRKWDVLVRVREDVCVCGYGGNVRCEGGSMEGGC